MGSINPQLYSDVVYTFPSATELSGFSSVPACTTTTGCAMWGSEDSFIIPMIDNGVLDALSSPDSDVRTSVMAVPGGSFPHHDQQLGVLDGVVPTAAAFSDYNNNNMDGLHGISVMQNNYGHHDVVGYQPADHQACEFGDECCGFFMPDVKPLGILPTDNWGIQSNQIHTLEDSNIKVGRYSEEERKKRILRYLAKRHHRNFNKTIKYACRKTLADRRVRVRGRFARNNNELCDHQEIMVPKKNNDVIIPTRKDRSDVCCVDAVQMKYDEEDWLQEAMASLMCLPYVAG